MSYAKVLAHYKSAPDEGLAVGAFRLFAPCSKPPTESPRGMQLLSKFWQEAPRKIGSARGFRIDRDIPDISNLQYGQYQYRRFELHYRYRHVPAVLLVKFQNRVSQRSIVHCEINIRDYNFKQAVLLPRELKQHKINSEVFFHTLNNFKSSQEGLSNGI